MTALSKSELDFLKQHKLELNDFLDANSSTLSNWKELGKRAGKRFAIRDSCTKNLGHLFVTSSGHCIQCDVSRIAFRIRDTAPGYVYIAISVTKKIVKVGTSTDVERRRKQARLEGYGGASDWQELHFVEVSEAGRLERETHKMLAKYAVSGRYKNDGKMQVAREIFNCSFSQAQSALIEATRKNNMKLLSEWTDRNWRRLSGE